MTTINKNWTHLCHLFSDLPLSDDFLQLWNNEAGLFYIQKTICNICIYLFSGCSQSADQGWGALCCFAATLLHCLRFSCSVGPHYLIRARTPSLINSLANYQVWLCCGSPGLRQAHFLLQTLYLNATLLGFIPIPVIMLVYIPLIHP